MKQAILLRLLCIALLFAFLSTSAQYPATGTLASETKSGKTNSSVKNNYTGSWYAEAAAKLQTAGYSFHPSGEKGSFKTVNTENRIAATVSYNNYLVSNISTSADEERWNVDFHIRGTGRDGSLSAPANHSDVSLNTVSVSYTSGNTRMEYVNNQQGIRQNFEINKRPSGKGYLKVRMHISSNLTASLQNDKLIFFDKENPGKVKLTYTDLRVWDADHKSLPAHMEYNPSASELTIVADDAGAVFPVFIDPISQVPEWSTSADGLLSGLINNADLLTSLYGFTVTSLGDVSGDGIGDVAISAPGVADIFSGSGTLAAVGSVYVYYGTDTGLHTVPDNILQPNTAVAGALFGFSVAAGDVTGDGRNDIIIGAPMDKYTVHVKTALLGGPPLGTGPLFADVTVTAGKVYIYKGDDLPNAPNPSSFLEIKLSDSYFSTGILGLLGNNINVKSLFGFSVAATDDLNTDGKKELVIGSPSYLGTNLLEVQNGAAFVYYSGNLGTATPVELQPPSASLLGLVQFPLVNSSSLLFGFSVDGAGDYNSDGYPDIIVGAPAGVDLSSLGGIFSGQFLGGSAYVYYGNNSGGINTSIGAKLQGSPSGLLANAANLFGYKVKGMKNLGGVYNGNVMIGAPVGGLIPNTLSLSIHTGNIQLFLKKPSSPGGVVVADQVIESPRSSSVLQVLNTLNLNVLFGASFDNAYDINCDSYPDLVVGEPLSSGTNLSQLQVNAIGGSVYILYGTSAGSFNPAPSYNVSATYGTDFMSVNAAALFGFSVAGIPKVKNASSTPRIITGSPSGALDFSSSMLNLGSTLNVLYSFLATDNGLGKAYTFNPDLCGSFHTLPAEPVTLNGQLEDATIHLNWLAKDEKNIIEYVLEKSMDGTSFSTMVYVFAKGNDDHNNYTMNDYHPAKVNYYRLRIIHKDNSYVYSTVVKIKIEEQVAGEVTVAPNPVISNYKLKLTGLENGTYTIEIKNSTGLLLQKKSIVLNEYDHTESMIKDNSMLTGIYFINLYDRNNRRVKTIKFLIK
jgi:hypothetical protein